MVKDDESKELKQQVPYLYLGTSALVRWHLVQLQVIMLEQETEGDQLQLLTVWQVQDISLL